MKRLMIMLMLAITVAPVAGCVVAPVRPVYAPRPACVWVPAHYNAFGHFIPAHCR